MRKSRVWIELLISFVVLFCVALLVEGKGKDDFIEVILSMSTFLFAILLAFTISSRQNRLNKIQTTLRVDDARLLNIYCFSKQFGKRVSKRCLKIIDDYLQVSIDYTLPDYHQSTTYFLKLTEFVAGIKPKNNTQLEVKNSMLQEVSDSLKNQKEITYLVKNRLSFIEWISLYILAFIVIFSLFYVNSGGPSASLIIALIGSTIVLLLLVLRDIDSLEWKERNWIWKPLEELFLELGLAPYFQAQVLEEKRVKQKHLDKLERYRIAVIPNPYPDMTGKEVKLVENKTLPQID